MTGRLELRASAIRLGNSRSEDRFSVTIYARGIGATRLPNRKARIGLSGSDLIVLAQRLIDIVEPTAATVDELKKLNLPAGVDISINV